ncbi:MAG TPA: deoxyribose-phosphate aldolase [Cytophagales bacterium]|nr:deoxyribose-phosphate aldolase [Cytophagales bacterium]HCR54509.1 deoxyribose-phosphate aldolase [Cytophagales bacterium]
MWHKTLRSEVDIAKVIEYTNLKPTVTVGEIDQLAADAVRLNLFGICVPPFWVKRAKRELGNAMVALVTVVGFPMGYQMTETKVDEAKRAMDNGADEIDWVWNISAFKTGLPWTKIELAKASKLIHDQEKILKVIIETSLLSDEDIILACKICSDAGADFVKTSTGYAGEGATIPHVQLMRQHLPPMVGIKAAGGIKHYKQAKDLIAAGADRIGTSSALSVINIQ